MPHFRSPLLRAFLLFAAAMLSPIAAAQDQSTAPAEGLRENPPGVHAFVGAKLVVAPGKVIDDGVLVIRDGLIIAAGMDRALPDDARVWDMKGKTIYAGFLDAFSEQEAAGDSGGPGYWNERVTPQMRVERSYKPDAALNKKLRAQGVTARLVAPSGNVIKGQSAVVTTGDDSLSRAILLPAAALHARLTPSSRGRDDFPNSPMGAYTLVRQAFFDADWYGKAWAAYESGQANVPRPERNDALAALAPFAAGKLPVVIDAHDELYDLRADRIGKELNLNVIVRGSGYEYRRLEAIKQAGRAVIVPLNFPRAPYVKSPELARQASLEELMHWDIAPENPARLAQAGVKIAFTSQGLREQATLLGQVREAVRRGLSGDAALAALTIAPAEIFGLQKRLGTLEVGKAASFVVTEGDLFDKKTKVLETWVDGRRYEAAEQPQVDVRGTWEVTLTAQGKPEKFAIELGGEPDKLKGTLQLGEKKTDLADVELDGGQLRFSVRESAFAPQEKPDEKNDEQEKAEGAEAEKKADEGGIAQVSAAVTMPKKEAEGNSTWLGNITWPDGGQSPLTAKQTAGPKEGANNKDDEQDAEQKKNDEEEAKWPKTALFAVNYPLGAFGRAAPPEQPAAVLFKNATVWTCGEQGILQNASVLVQAGQIVQVSTDIAAPEGAIIVDCQGKHITPGIIDCHSHIATDGGVNESSQSITCEVRIGDYIDPSDISIYRQLAGGVTAANILHGSANTIGGQNQVIKFRWGALPEEMKFAEAPQGVKFALGENVKQSNWGERFTTRYPQTRMGVEQIVRDALRAAIAYRQRWDEWNTAHTGTPPRRDLELEALAEVVAGTRLIHCHSYRQDEILALMRTCEFFGIKIATFQHILEGYKVADAMAKHGAGGSAFSDWWAYKFEVYDAIPYAGSLMHEAGVVVSFNSDDAELARRLNLEAAKAVKYGGVPEAEALKFVTLNPAKQLGIDQWVGSLAAGKQADLVVWSGSPLSTLSRCEQTWIDGRKYFDRDEDQKLRDETRTMRAALVQRILASGAAMEKPGESGKPAETIWARYDEFCGHGRHVVE